MNSCVNPKFGDRSGGGTSIVESPDNLASDRAPGQPIRVWPRFLGSTEETQLPILPTRVPLETFVIVFSCRAATDSSDVLGVALEGDILVPLANLGIKYG